MVDSRDVTPLSDGLTATAARLLGLAAVIFSGLYVLSDLIETAQGGFSGPQLVLTLVAEAAIPFFVVGLYAVQRPLIGRLGLVSAVAYAYSYVFFTGTVVYAMVNATSDYSALSRELGASMTIHGAIMVFAGIGFGVAVIRAGVLPRWPAVALAVGVVAVAATQAAPGCVQLVAAGIRAAAFAGMGIALIAGPTPLCGSTRTGTCRRTSQRPSPAHPSLW